MYVSKLALHNFRSFTDFEVQFTQGLNLLVGENNIGKSHVMDALRIVGGLGSGYRDLYPRPQDIRHDPEGAPVGDSFEIRVTFSGLNEEQAGWFVELLVPSEGPGIAKLTYQYRKVIGRGSRDFYASRVWGGLMEGPQIPAEVLESLRCVFLQPLRDAAADLRPGRSSRTAVLLERLAEPDTPARDAMVSAIDSANETIQQLPLVQDASSRINQGLQEIAGRLLAQRSKLVMSEPSFRRIAQSLKTLVGPSDDSLFAVDENGLGYNNILYAATVLAEMQQANAENPDLGVLLIEEPEAHLHPQLQAPFVRYLEQHAENNVQVIATTHSSVIASSVGVERSIVIHKSRLAADEGVFRSKRLDSCGLDSADLRLLSRYLDITRSCLLFARGVILVEGISELLLLPIFAKKLNLDMKENAVTVVSTGGLSFRPFYKLFKDDNLRIPCAVVTDGDPAEDGGEYQHGSRATNLNADMDGGCCAFISRYTFEYELALAGNSETMIAAFQNRHSSLGQQLRQDYDGSGTAEEKANAIRRAISNQYKADLAQDLMEHWTQNADDLSVPPYLEAAIRHACGATA